jgi:hypothetical protein
LTDLTVDASVWMAAADQRDAFHQESRDLLSAATVNELIQRAGAITPTDWLNGTP